MIGLLDQYAHFGRDAFLRIEHADLVVRQPYVGDARIESAQTFSQADIQRVYRAVACGRCGVERESVPKRLWSRPARLQ